MRMKFLILLLIVVITLTFSKVNCAAIAEPLIKPWDNTDLCEQFKVIKLIFFFRSFIHSIYFFYVLICEANQIIL